MRGNHGLSIPAKKKNKKPSLEFVNLPMGVKVARPYWLNAGGRLIFCVVFDGRLFANNAVMHYFMSGLSQFFGAPRNPKLSNAPVFDSGYNPLFIVAVFHANKSQCRVRSVRALFDGVVSRFLPA